MDKRTTGYCRLFIGRRAIVVATGLASLLALGPRVGAQPEARTPPTYLESLEVNVVNVDVFVTDKKGEPVAGLRAKDFDIFEDGKKMTLTNFLAIEGTEPVVRAAGETPNEDDLEIGDAPAPESRYVVLFVDNYAIHPYNRKLVLDELRRLLEQGLQGGSEFMVASYDGYLRVLQPFTDDPARLLAAVEELEELSPLAVARRLQRFAFLKGSLTTLRMIQRDAQNQFMGRDPVLALRSLSGHVDAHAESLRQEKRAAFYAMSHLLNALAALQGRNAFVYISDGLPMRPAEAMYHAITEATLQPDLLRGIGGREASIEMRSAALGALSHTSRGRRNSRRDKSPPDDLEALIALANASRVGFYTIKPQGNMGGIPAELEGDAAELYTPQLKSIRENNLAETLRVMATETGGAAVVGSDLEGLLARVEADSRSYYSLGYSPKHFGDGRFHRIKVQVRRRGLRTRHRTGYIDKTVETQLADRTTSALLLGLDSNPLGISIVVTEGRASTKKDEWIVPVTVIVPLDNVAFLRQGELYACDAQLYVAAKDLRGDPSPVRVLSLRIEVLNPAAAHGQTYGAQLNLSLRKGPQRIAVGFVEAHGSTASFVSRNLVVGAGPAEAGPGN